MPPTSRQVKIDFEKMTESGLKPIAKKFEKWQCPVVSIEATNKGKRESGFLIKDFTFVFEDGQKLLVRVKGDGTVFQTKLNNKVVPVRHVDDIDKAIVEMVNYVQENAKAYERAKIQREKARRQQVKKPKVVTSRAEKIAGYTEKFNQVAQSNTELQKQLDEIAAAIADKQEELGKADQALVTERKRTDELTAEIKTLEEKQAA
ncbi:MAG: hypothetical protein IJU76_14185 [Desulfovibrionaceae bacterium]|nr:hypothetical protein [Desulfovibrionaceae bacterium]